MNNYVIILIAAISFMIYNLLSHLIDRKMYIHKQEKFKELFKLLIEHPDIVEKKQDLFNFLVKIETDIDKV